MLLSVGRLRKMASVKRRCSRSAAEQKQVNDLRERTQENVIHHVG